MSANLGTYIEQLGKLWSHPSWKCYPDYPSNFQKNDCSSDFDRNLDQVQNEVCLAEL